MNIFVAHASSFDFYNELYKPLRESILNEQHNIKLPQENGRETITKDIIKEHDIVVAEASYASTGQGIELGWADALGVPVVCIYKTGYKPSAALDYVADMYIEYDNATDMVEKLKGHLDKIKK